MSAILALETMLSDYCTANNIIYVQENQTYSGIDDHILSFELPTEPSTGINSGASVFHRNIWQITINVKKGTFAGKARSIINDLLSIFAVGKYTVSGANFTEVYFGIEKAWKNPSFYTDGWYQTPISIRYQEVV